MTYRKTLSQHAGLLQFPWPTKLLHISTEVTLSTLWPHAGFAALTPEGRRHVSATLNSSTSRSVGLGAAKTVQRHTGDVLEAEIYSDKSLCYL